MATTTLASTSSRQCATCSTNRPLALACTLTPRVKFAQVARTAPLALTCTLTPRVNFAQVARVPYFAYLSVMHLRETFGSRTPGDSERMRTHYAEADNELHHLLIMESLGGNSSVIDRTIAQTMAFTYYWYVVGVYSVSEQAAYHLSELIEDHAYNTYDGFLTKNEAMLKTKPVPDIARKYYERDNPFLFDLFCTVKEGGLGSADLDPLEQFSRSRPPLDSLYDVFVNVRNDEREHWKTLCNLVQFDDMQGFGGAIAGTKAAPQLEAPGL